jgi:hypothetical protein
MIENEVAARGVIENEAALLQKMNDLTGLEGGQFCHHFAYIKCKTYKTSSNSRRVGEVENFMRSSLQKSYKTVYQMCEAVAISA